MSTVGNSSKNSSISSSSVFNQRVYLMTILILEGYDNIEIGYHYSSLYKWDTYVHLDESNTTFSLSCTLETPGL